MTDQIDAMDERELSKVVARELGWQKLHGDGYYWVDDKKRRQHEPMFATDCSACEREVISQAKRDGVVKITLESVGILWRCRFWFPTPKPYITGTGNNWADASCRAFLRMRRECKDD